MTTVWRGVCKSSIAFAMLTPTHTNTHSSHTYTHTNTHTHTHTHTYGQPHTLTDTCTLARTHPHTHAHNRMDSRMHKHTCTTTCTHTCTQTHTRTLRQYADLGTNSQRVMFHEPVCACAWVFCKLDGLCDLLAIADGVGNMSAGLTSANQNTGTSQSPVSVSSDKRQSRPARVWLEPIEGEVADLIRCPRRVRARLVSKAPAFETLFCPILLFCHSTLSVTWRTQ